MKHELSLPELHMSQTGGSFCVCRSWPSGAAPSPSCGPACPASQPQGCEGSQATGKQFAHVDGPILIHLLRERQGMTKPIRGNCAICECFRRVPFYRLVSKCISKVNRSPFLGPLMLAQHPSNGRIIYHFTTPLLDIDVAFFVLDCSSWRGQS